MTEITLDSVIIEQPDTVQIKPRLGKKPVKAKPKAKVVKAKAKAKSVAKKVVAKTKPAVKKDAPLKKATRKCVWVKPASKVKLKAVAKRLKLQLNEAIDAAIDDFVIKNKIKK